MKKSNNTETAAAAAAIALSVCKRRAQSASKLDCMLQKKSFRVSNNLAIVIHCHDLSAPYSKCSANHIKNGKFMHFGLRARTAAVLCIFYFAYNFSTDWAISICCVQHLRHRLLRVAWTSISANGFLNFSSYWMKHLMRPSKRNKRNN